MTRIVHKYKEPFDIDISRPSKWGNPYTHLEPGLARVIHSSLTVVKNRNEAIKMYEIYIRNNPELMASLPELRNKILGCWCKPKACHGDVLVKLVKELDNPLFS